MFLIVDLEKISAARKELSDFIEGETVLVTIGFVLLLIPLEEHATPL